MKIQAQASTRRVYVDHKILDPRPSQAVMNHSPDGFAWGYSGSGPAQLALALTLRAAGLIGVPFGTIRQYYQDVKSHFVAAWPMDEDVDGDFDIEGFLKRKLSEKEVQ